MKKVYQNREAGNIFLTYREMMQEAAEEAEKAYNAAVARYNDLRPNANESAKTIYNGVPRL